jgi:nicotinamidase-related amidase
MAKALMVVDVQFSMFFGDWALPDGQELLKAIGDRILDARESGTLVVHVQNDGPEDEPDAPGLPMWELVFSPTDQELVVRKTTLNVFESNPELGSKLKGLGIDELEFIGVQSELCLRSSALGAIEQGFKISVPAGLHSTYDGGYPGATSGPSAAELRAAVQKELAAASESHG